VAARGAETVLLARRMNVWYDQLVNRIKSGDVATFTKDKGEPSTWPATAQGYGYLDAPRGALGHWCQIADGKITRYQCVVPSTWNAGPRDPQGIAGPYEAALTDNHPLVDPERPLEILRTVHSFDPCMACGVHVLDATGKTITEVKVQ
jgi:hydrogenase large subunit